MHRRHHGQWRYLVLEKVLRLLHPRKKTAAQDYPGLRVLLGWHQHQHLELVQGFQLLHPPQSELATQLPVLLQARLPVEMVMGMLNTRWHLKGSLHRQILLLQQRLQQLVVQVKVCHRRVQQAHTLVRAQMALGIHESEQVMVSPTLWVAGPLVVVGDHL